MSVPQLSQLLSAHRPAPDVAGCLVPNAIELDDDFPIACFGGLDALGLVVEQHEIQQVIVSLPLALIAQAQMVSRTLDHLGVPWRFLPTLADQLSGRALAALRAMQQSQEDAASSSIGLLASPFVDPMQLLDRRPRGLDERAIRDTLTNKVVMITGAGGSIGSEIARIVARFEPSRLVLLERSENALFEIEREIAHRFPTLQRKAVLHDIANASRTQALLQQLRPAVVFHAAAHKHVPMMEEHPADAIENNFYGTRSIADAAHACGCERFVMISSDKAVNPSSVMGATKRLAELYVQDLNRRSRTIFSMVRFGNVLGSACSVLPIWAKQIAQGRAITVTDPRMTRYFMTIPEAAGLVLQSGAIACGEGEVFLLDMGAPVRIVDLAQRFIRSQGLEPNVDVRIEFIGVRPGEKLFEELAYDSEDMLQTSHESIRLYRIDPPSPERMTQIIAMFDKLRSPSSEQGHLWDRAQSEALLAALRSAVPEMVPAATRAKVG
jgi:FlaA1/EpsC-like NDP-sugar epimerase